jgi:3-oxoacyl-[acyl-carrier protein] reductase
MTHDLNGRVAIVTGAGSGIGQATVWLLAERGAAVLVQDIDRDSAAVTAAQLDRQGCDFVVLICDIADPQADRRIVETALDRWGALDILVNNAGIGIDHPIEDIDEPAFDRMFAVHVKGTFFTTQAAFPALKRSGRGRIINTSSRWALAGHDQASDYVAAKSAILGLTKAWAREMAPYRITVNAIAPGGVKTAMVRRTIGESGIAAEEKQVPLGRWSDPSEIAATTAFLASDAAAFITGQVVSPNGGKTMVGF